jgi:hypothetical protein
MCCLRAPDFRDLTLRIARARGYSPRDLGVVPARPGSWVEATATEECEGQSGLVADAAEALVDDLLGLANGVRRSWPVRRLSGGPGMTGFLAGHPVVGVQRRQAAQSRPSAKADRRHLGETVAAWTAHIRPGTQRQLAELPKSRSTCLIWVLSTEPRESGRHPLVLVGEGGLASAEAGCGPVRVPGGQFGPTGSTWAV